MSRKQLVEFLLRKKGRFTMAYISRRYPKMFYTIRNGVSECRRGLAEEGYTIRHFYGSDWRGNGYELVKK